MKRVIMLLLITFLFVPLKIVKAISNDLPINKDIRINGVDEKYRWYKLKEVDSRDENVFEHSCEYLELRETDFSDWDTVKPEEKYGRFIEEKETSDEEEQVKYSQILISNILSPSLHIKELILYDDKSNVISYSKAKCLGCMNEKQIKYIYDNDYNTSFEIKYNSSIKLFLDEETSCNIRIHIIFEHDDYIYGWKVSALDKDTGDVIYQKEETIDTLVQVYSPIYNSYINSRTNSWINNESIKYYRYKDSYLVCQTKEYLEDYYEYMEDYIKDENSFIKEYDYEEIEPITIEKEVEVFKEIVVPKEKIVNKYITIEKEKQVDNVNDNKHITEAKDNNPKKKLNLKIYVVFTLFLSTIILLCLFLRELIKKCR